MALQKTFNDPTGANPSYHIIASISVDKLSESASITLAGYQDQQTRLDHPREGIVQRRNVRVPTVDFLPLYTDVVNGTKNLYEAAYDYVKNNADDFSDATDV